MAKVDLIKDLLVKINNIFSHDMFIIRNRIVVAGLQSFDRANGRYVCILNENIKQEYDAVLGVNAIIKISSIKEAKKEFKDNIIAVNDVTEFDKADQDEINHNLVIFDEAIKIEEWLPLESELDDETIDSIFNKGGMTNLFVNEDCPSFTIGKTILPLIKEKNIGDVYYSKMTNVGEGIWKIFLKIEHPYFIAYLCFWILD